MANFTFVWRSDSLIRIHYISLRPLPMFLVSTSYLTFGSPICSVSLFSLALGPTFKTPSFDTTTFLFNSFSVFSTPSPFFYFCKFSRFSATWPLPSFPSRASQPLFPLSTIFYVLRHHSTVPVHAEMSLITFFELSSEKKFRETSLRKLYMPYEYIVWDRRTIVVVST